ncbi:BatD family protein [Pseudidiomarina salilacus]|uniref:BatD family protein n=1 Tax=Pseudidiomarina salilacus TaxID=3384452 RepID=UPI0039852C4B
MVALLQQKFVTRWHVVSQLILVLMFTLASIPSAMAQNDAPNNVTISVDKNPVAAGDTVILTVTVDQLVSDAAWRPRDVLTDFRVLGSSSSRNTQIINGDTRAQTTFNTILQVPSAAESYTIGPITIEGTASNRVELKVLPEGEDAELNAQRKAFMKVEMSRDRVFVQEQVQLVTKLYLAANLHSGNIIPPQLADADIRQVGSDSETSEIIDGKKFQVFTRTYLIIPQRSGEQTIQGPVFQGQINANSSRTMFPSFSSTEALTTAAQDIPLTVEALPADWPSDSDWLPAELVSLSVSVGNEGSEQESTQQQYTQGEPITLTYRLTAVGPLPDQLPRLNKLVQQLAIEGATLYPESPESASNQRNGKIISQQTLRVTVLPTQAGELKIPSLQVDWFNTQMREADIATAPAQTFSIAAGAMPSDLPELPASEPTAETTASDTTPTVIEERVDHAQLRWWQIGAGAIAVLWLLTLIWGWRRGRRATVADTTTTATPEVDAQSSLHSIRKACLGNDSVAAEQLLKRWAQRTLGLRSTQLSSIADSLGHVELRSQLLHLQQCRYAASANDWQQGKALWKALQEALKQTPKKAPNEQLPQLYPPN